MEMWNSIDNLRALSHGLMWASAILAIFAAIATGVRFYVDRRAGELSSQAQRVSTEIKEQSQSEREAVLTKQLEAAKREQQEASTKLSTLEQKMKRRHLSPEQSSTLASMARKACTSLPMVNVTAANSNNEAQVYATEFVKILKAAGCASDLSLPIPGLTPDVIGIHIGVRDPQNLSPGAIELSKMLSSSGIQFSISPLKPDFFPDAPFVLVIGAKQL